MNGPRPSSKSSSKTPSTPARTASASRPTTAASTSYASSTTAAASSPEELPLAFERHATSKLAAGIDLDSIVTLGFRGEALPSVAAVAEVEAVSRVHGSPRAARVKLAFGELLEVGAVGAPEGTSITVRNLFRQQPARLKFLRSAGAEAAQIAAIVTHYALAYPEVAFSLKLDGRESFATSGTGDRRDAAAGVYGAAVAATMLPVDETTEGGTVMALCAPPSTNRASRSHITVFINRRWVRSRSLNFAVEEAYAGLLPTGRFPVAVVDLRLPPEEVDVNVHPAKAEVRLRNERQVFALVQRPLRRVLSGLAPPGSAPFGSLAARFRVVRLRYETPQAESEAPFFLLPEPLQSRMTVDVAATGLTSQPALPAPRIPILRALGQAGTTYVIAEGPAGLYLIDQHAAHERVLYERFLRGEEESKASQPLLAPVVLELTPQQGALAGAYADELREHGFEVEPFGGGGYLLRAAPAGLRREDPARAFVELLELVTREDSPADPGVASPRRWPATPRFVPAKHWRRRRCGT